MAFCTNCGHQLAEGAKFCFECGAKVDGTEEKIGEQRKTVYDGEIHKCPNCGDILDANELICSACGYERRNINVSTFVRDFEKKYGSAETVDQKVDLIRTVGIPNTREDINEFLFLALVNIDTYSFENLEVEDYLRLSDAWMAKFEQTHLKGTMLLGNIPILQELNRRYVDKKRSVELTKKRLLAKKFCRRNQALMWVLCGISIFALVVGGIAFSINFEERRLEKIAEQVEEYIENEEFEEAEALANQLRSDSKFDAKVERWDKIRNSLLIKIAEAQGLPKPTLCVNISSENLKGMHYEDVKNFLRKQGFTDIQLKSESGWFAEDYSVKSVSINECTGFSSEDCFPLDAVIVITYYE